MLGMQQVADLVVRQTVNTVAATSATAAAAAATSSSTTPACTLTNDFYGRLGERISYIIGILMGSVFGINALTS